MAKEYRQVSIITEVPNRKPFWNKVGVAFDNSDGSLNVQLCFMPGVKLHIGIPKEVNGDEPPEQKDTPF